VNPSFASLICVCGIAGLFYLGRDASVRTSKALWLPFIWILLVGSRPVSFWLGITPPAGTDIQLVGSPVDAFIFELLLAAAVVVLVWRRRRVLTLLSTNWPILLYFSYCLVSISWAYYPDIAFKRWIKAIGDLAMALVIATDAQPVAAFRRIISRIGFVLLPTSVLFIKYYGELGRGYAPDGLPMNTGVTANKNALGLLVLVISLGAVWNVRALIMNKDEPNRRRRLFAQSTLLTFGLVLFGMADCATCIACFMLGSGLLLATGHRSIRNRPARVHAMFATIVIVAGIAFLAGGDAGVVHALGRNSDLTGRTDIWSAVIPAVPNPIVGAGFESFWISPSVEIFRRKLEAWGWWHPENLNEAHNGYLEIYLNLGWIGVCMVALILIRGYRQGINAFRVYPEFGSLILAYVAAATIYGITEAGFRSLNLSWIFLLLALFLASGVTAGLVTDKHKIRAAHRRKPNRNGLTGELIPESQPSVPTAGVVIRESAKGIIEAFSV
jgi:exopolysaccharide production protein ExoQ